MAESIEEDQEEINDEIKRLLDNKDAINTKKIRKLAYSVFFGVADVAKAEENHLRAVVCNSPVRRVK